MSDDTQNVDTVRKDVNIFLEEACLELEVPSIGDLSPTRVPKLLKDTMAKLFYRSLLLLEEFVGVTTTDFKAATNTVKAQMIESQKTIIQLQSDLIECKNEQVESMKAAVKSSVGESVKAEFQSYSSVLQKNCQQPTTSLNSEDLKKVVHTVVKEEDRSRNLMIFNLPENDNEDLNSLVGDLFQSIEEKPRVEACRLGSGGGKSKRTVRPVRVTVASSTIVGQILSKARHLKQVNGYKTVFLSPDRSPEQRVAQRELVQNLKQLIKEEPDKVHYLKNGKIISAMKKPN